MTLHTLGHCFIALAWGYTGIALMMSMLAGPFVLARAEPLIWLVLAAAHAPGFVWTYDRMQVMSQAEQMSLLMSWACVAVLLGSHIFVKRSPPQTVARKVHDGR